MTLRKLQAPYEGTTVAPSITKAQIEKLLLEAGAEAVRWTTGKDGSSVLEFILETDAQGVQRRFGVQIKSPTIIRERRRMVKEPGWYSAQKKLVHERDNAAEARMVHWYVKSLVEAAQFGLASVEQIFASHITVSLPSGETTTVGEVMEKSVRTGRLPTIEGFDQAGPALPPPPEEKRRTHQDADFTVVEEGP